MKTALKCGAWLAIFVMLGASLFACGGVTSIPAPAPGQLLGAPVQETTIEPTPTSTWTPTPIPTATRSPREQVADLLNQLDAVWGEDWPAAIDLLQQARKLDPTDQALADKLYAAYYSYGQLLVSQNKPVDAAAQFRYALAVNPNAGEAQQALLALTPTATATQTRIPAPATATLSVPAATSTVVIVRVPTTPPSGGGVRIGAVCRDGTSSSATGSGACSHHGGVDHWLYR